MIALARRLRRDQAGFTLTELLVVMVIAPLVLGAVLTSFSGFESSVERNQERAEAEDRTRQVSGRLARELRNLASPTPAQPQAVDHAQPFDLVFQTVDPTAPAGGANLANVRRVRYCLDAPAGGDGTLWSQSQTWTTALTPPTPSTARCPDPTWGNQRMAAAGLTNRSSTGAPRPLFTYNSATPTRISAVITELWVRSGSAREPARALLRSQVFLRNQNEAPTAAFDARPVGLLHLLLNGSASADPEGDELVYDWYSGPTHLGSGIVFDLAVANPGPLPITLRVRDPAGLEGTATRTVVVP